MMSIAQPTTGLNIELNKRTPAAAGMAGGSSNAAATIIALNEIWEMRLPRVELQKIATLLGSDIAFFLSPTSLATCRGRGEVVVPHHNNCRLHFVIARPKTGLSTALVYQNYKPTNSGPDSTPLSAALHSGDIRSIGRNMHNALQPVAEQLNPEIAQLRKAFSKLPVYSHMMTGSGTAYFGLCQTRSQACAAATRLKATGLDRVFVAQCPS
jgi:4-diphosphocytidyl-2-C-methyl-D-erythritol kinase